MQCAMYIAVHTHVHMYVYLQLLNGGYHTCKYVLTAIKGETAGVQRFDEWKTHT